MAARKKKKAKAKARRTTKKAPALNVVVGSKVKESVKSHGIRCSGDLVEALNLHVQDVIGKAVARAQANKRGTVRPQDL
jgi:histone H3/H4